MTEQMVMQSRVAHEDIEFMLCEAESGAKEAEHSVRHLESLLLKEQKVSQLLRRENRQLRRNVLNMGSVVVAKGLPSLDEVLAKYGGLNEVSRRFIGHIFELDCEVVELFKFNEELRSQLQDKEKALSSLLESNEKLRLAIRDSRGEMDFINRNTRSPSDVHFNEVTGFTERNTGDEVERLRTENGRLEATLRELAALQEDTVCKLHEMETKSNQRSELTTSLERGILFQQERRKRVEVEYSYDTGVFNMLLTFFIPRIRHLESQQSASDIRIVFEACEAAKREARVVSLMLKERVNVDERRVSDAEGNRHSKEIEMLLRANKELGLHNSVLQKSCEEWRRQSETQILDSTDEMERMRSELTLQLSFAHVSLDEQNVRLRELTKKVESLEKENRALTAKVLHGRGFEAFTQTYEDDWLTVSAKQEREVREVEMSALRGRLTQRELEVARLEGALQKSEAELENTRWRLKQSETNLMESQRSRENTSSELRVLRDLYNEVLGDMKLVSLDLTNRDRELCEARVQITAFQREIERLENGGGVQSQEASEQLREEIATLHKELQNERMERIRVERETEELQQLLAVTSTFVSSLETPGRATSIPVSAGFFSPASPPLADGDEGPTTSVWGTLSNCNAFEFLRSDVFVEDLPSAVRYLLWLQVSLVFAHEVSVRQELEATAFRGFIELSQLKRF